MKMKRGKRNPMFLWQGSVAAVHFIVTNAAKHDVDESSLVQEIQQLGLPKVTKFSPAIL